MSTSKKIFTFGLLGASSLVFSACNPFAPKQKTSDEPQTQAEVMQEGQKMAMAIKNGEGLHCIVTSAEGTTVEYDVKGQKMKMAGSNISQNGKMGYMINNSEYIYIWEEGAAQGIKNKIPTQEEMEQSAQAMEKFSYDAPDFSSAESVKSYEETGYTVKCDPKNLQDADFSPPSNVEFVDLAAQMQEAFSGMENKMENIQLPEGVNIPQIPAGQ